MEIKNKRIVVTGAGSGIGKETVLQMLKHENVKILACDLNEKNVISHPNVIPYKCDISKPETLDRLLKDADKKLGGIDIFFANAGFAYYEVIPEPNWDRIDRIFRTNVFSPFYTLVTLNRKRNTPCLFIVTASAMSHLPLPGYALYSATKASVRSFVEAYQCELKDGVQTMVVYPIATRTQFFDSAGKKVPVPFPSQTAETVAKQIIKGILSGKREVFPSFLFRFIQIVDRFLFFPLKVYQKIEAIKLNSHKS